MKQSVNIIYRTHNEDRLNVSLNQHYWKITSEALWLAGRSIAYYFHYITALNTCFFVAGVFVPDVATATV